MNSDWQFGFDSLLALSIIYPTVTINCPQTVTKGISNPAAMQLAITQTSPKPGRGECSQYSTFAKRSNKQKNEKTERKETNKGNPAKRVNEGGKEEDKRKKKRARSLAERDPSDLTSHNHTPSCLLFLLPRHPLHIARTILRALIQSRITLTALPLPLEEAQFLRFHRRRKSSLDNDVLASTSAVTASWASNVSSWDGRCWRWG
jgi:hypothetical protein